MKQTIFCCFLIVALQTISWIHIPAIFIAAGDVGPLQGSKGGAIDGISEETYSNRMVGRLGSRPPNCQHKCGSCIPCIPTQIPATSDKPRPQNTNCEPEGWKCKCGPTFFNP